MIGSQGSAQNGRRMRLFAIGWRTIASGESPAHVSLLPTIVSPYRRSPSTSASPPYSAPSGLLSICVYSLLLVFYTLGLIGRVGA